MGSRWLVISSFFFTIPCIYAYYHGLHFHAGILLAVSLISANYWRNAKNSWRRNLDLFFAKLSFVIFACNGIVYVREKIFLITGYPATFLALYCFYLSGVEYKKRKEGSWFRYHMAFHLLITYLQMIVLSSMINFNKL